MRSHCTHPTVLWPPTIAVLSAAALLVGCEQTTGPAPTASRPGGGIVADAQTGTVSAHGVGVVVGVSCIFFPQECNEGGKGLDFSFDFSGTNNPLFGGIVPVTGTWSAKDPVTNVQLDFTGSGSVDLPNHTLTVGGSGTCIITGPAGTVPGFNCSLCAFDGASNGALDEVRFSGFNPNGAITTTGDTFNPPCFAQNPASGNINID